MLGSANPGLINRGLLGGTPPNSDDMILWDGLVLGLYYSDGELAEVGV